MKFKQFLFAAFIAAFAGMAMVGCNENPDDPGTGDDVNPVTNLEAVSLSSTSVGLRWTASTTSGVDEYRISVRGPGGTSVTDTAVTGTSATIAGLTAGTIYTFGVTAVETDIASGDDESTETTILWSPAQRITSDSRVTGTLRVYPQSVTGKGSGIVLTSTGAYNALVGGTPSSTSDHGKIQLIADLNVGAATFTIGAPEAFTQFANHSSFRTDVQISDETYAITSLDTWYNDASLESLFSTANDGFFTLQDAQTAGQNVGFALRWGSPGQYRYARVMVVAAAGGNLIKTDSNGDPYVEVQFSYQDAPGVPYAKGN